MNPETMRFEPVTDATPSDWAQFAIGELIPLKGWWWKVERCGENLLILSVVKKTKKRAATKGGGE